MRQNYNKHTLSRVAPSFMQSVRACIYTDTCAKLRMHTEMQWRIRTVRRPTAHVDCFAVLSARPDVCELKSRRPPD